MRALGKRQRRGSMDQIPTHRNDIGDRAGPYKLKTFTLRLRVSEPGRKCDSPGLAAEVARAILSDLDIDREHFLVLALNAQLRVTGFKVASSGGVTATIVDPRVVFRSALLLGAVSIVLAHNHPSGDPTPSADDRALTKRLALAGKTLEIQVHDHVIIGDSGFFSFAASAPGSL